MNLRQAIDALLSKNNCIGSYLTSTQVLSPFGTLVRETLRTVLKPPN